MKRTVLIGSLIVLALVAAGIWWWFGRHRAEPTELTLYGNVDLREIDLAFNNNERISAVLVQEGDHVKAGQLLARLDTSRLTPQVAQSAANVEMDEVGAANASRQYNRAAQLMGASGGRNISRQDYENAKAAMDSANAKVNASKAQLTILQQQLNDADLYAPTNATVRTRVLEPGEMASPQRPVLALVMTDPKWVRVYVVESDLGKLRPGMAATVSVDGFPNRPFQGWVGFISSMAEFTPKSIETAELRTSLVYEVRVFVKDPLDVMRLGMPATVHLPLSPLPKTAAQ